MKCTATTRLTAEERRALRDAAAQEAWDRHYPSGEHDGAFIDGARWFAAGMAVCEFLSDLAAQVNTCPECDGSGREFKYPEWDCYVCDGTGKREAP